LQDSGQAKETGRTHITNRKGANQTLARPAGILNSFLDLKESYLHTGLRLDERKWAHIVRTWDGTMKGLWVGGQQVGSWHGPVKATS